MSQHSDCHNNNCHNTVTEHNDCHNSNCHNSDCHNTVTVTTQWLNTVTVTTQWSSQHSDRHNTVIVTTQRLNTVTVTRQWLNTVAVTTVNVTTQWLSHHSDCHNRRTPARRTRRHSMMMMMNWCLMSSDVNWRIRDKLWPMPKHGSRILYVHGIWKLEGSLVRTAQDGHLDSHTAPELW